MYTHVCAYAYMPIEPLTIYHVIIVDIEYVVWQNF